MDKMAIPYDIRKLIENEFSVDLSHVTDSEDLLSSGIIDSQNFLEFILIVEEHYKCEINPMEVNLSELVTIKGITEYLCNLN